MTRESDNLFLQHKKLIYNRINEFSKKYSLPAEELEGRALELFCEAAISFDKIRGVKFSTYLWHKLNSLNDFGKMIYIQRMNQVSIDLLPNLQSSDRYKVILEDSIETELSEKSQMVLESLRKAEMLKLTAIGITRHFGWHYGIASRIVAELREWWEDFSSSEVWGN